MARRCASFAWSRLTPRSRAWEALAEELAQAPPRVACALILLEKVATVCCEHRAISRAGCPWAVQDQPPERLGHSSPRDSLGTRCPVVVGRVSRRIDKQGSFESSLLTTYLLTGGELAGPCTLPYCLAWPKQAAHAYSQPAPPGGGRAREQLILDLASRAQMKHARLGLRLGAAQARMRRLAAANASATVDAGGSPRAVRGAGSVARGGRASLVRR